MQIAVSKGAIWRMAIQDKQANPTQKLQEAVQLHQQRQFDQAALHYVAILKAQPEHFDAMHLLGVVRSQQGRHAEALDKIQAALKLNPASAEALSNLGLVLKKMNRRDEALASYDKALEIRPDFVDALNNRGNTLLELKRFEEALASYDRALVIRPDYAEALNDRGLALRELKRPDEALASYDRALAIKPDYALSLINRGNALLELKRFEEALASYDRALAIKPDYAEALINRGNVLQELKRSEEALASYDKALAIRPDYVDARINRSMLLGLLGQLPESWREMEWRKRTEKNIGFREYSQPEWLGEHDLRSKTLFVHFEQGLGDTIQFCRYLPMIESRGATVIFSCQNSIKTLIQTLIRTIKVIGQDEVPRSFDYHTPLMSMPLALRTDVKSIPAEVPYLKADLARVEKWRARIGSEGFKIGISWHGSKLGTEIGKSFKLRELEPISKITNVRLISLQKNDCAEQTLDLPMGMIVETLGNDFDAGPDGFLDTAAVMETVDLVITTDTSIAHLAGALGRPVWVALKHVPDWRWLLYRSDSPWYPTMRLFRQETSGDWAVVFSNVAHDLANLIHSGLLEPLKAHIPRVPISWGELIDKITILEIKCARIVNEAALANVRRELSLLSEIGGAQIQAPEALNLTSKLRRVNEDLWEIEDRIRDKELTKEFDADFIGLARSVYKRNDERAAIKREINILLASEIIEEKSYKNY
jgi:tetratricopeptide (TPR) repeat protein